MVTFPILLLILLLGVGLGLPGVILLAAGVRFASKERRINAEGVTIQAEISDLQAVDRRSPKSGLVRYTYLMTFRYSPPGVTEPTESTAAVSRQVFKKLTLGQRITARYLPNDPKNVRVLDVPVISAVQYVTLQASLLLAAMLFGCLGIWLFVLPAAQKQADQNATASAYANTRTPREAALTADYFRIQLQPIRGEIEAKLDTFRQEAADRAQTYDPELLGIRYDLAQIYYGRCDGRFYVFAVEGVYRGSIYVSRLGYAYLEDGLPPEGCSTGEFGSLFSRSGQLGGGWYAVEAIRAD